jgi:predicted amino acid racemase
VDEMDLAARYCDISLIADDRSLRLLDEAAARAGTRPGVLLMLDTGDLREGAADPEELCELAMLAEQLPHLHLLGVGAAFACLNGVLPTYENLTYLVNSAELVEARIGRTLEIISGGSSINLLLMMHGNQMPKRINHLRLGGTIAAPANIRRGRGVSFPNLREDTMYLSARLIEVRVKDSAPKATSAQNWAGHHIQVEDKGKRCRAIAAIGSQDIGDAAGLLPLDAGVNVVGCSSDHTVLDVTDSEKAWESGELVRFSMQYMPMLRAFSGRHVAIRYTDDSGKDI